MDQKWFLPSCHPHAFNPPCPVEWNTGYLGRVWEKGQNPVDHWDASQLACSCWMHLAIPDTGLLSSVPPVWPGSPWKSGPQGPSPPVGLHLVIHSHLRLKARCLLTSRLHSWIWSGGPSTTQQNRVSWLSSLVLSPELCLTGAVPLLPQEDPVLALKREDVRKL